MLTLANEAMYWIQRLYDGTLARVGGVVATPSTTRTSRTKPPRTSYFREVEAWQQTMAVDQAGTGGTITTVIPARTAISDPGWWIELPAGIVRLGG